MRAKHASFLACIATLFAAGSFAQSADAVQAHWRPQEIQFTYTGFTTAYTCDGLESKVRRIVTTLGGHPSTRVTATGCILQRPSRTAFVHIVTAMPRAASEPEPESAGNRPELLQRLGLGDDFDRTLFTAAWKTIQLSDRSKLDLAPGDCELMAELRDQVLPKLGVKIVEQNINCTPHQLGITAPSLRVSALTPTQDKNKG